MVKEYDSYEALKIWKEAHIDHYLLDTRSLNQFHDKIIKDVFHVALMKVKEIKGTPPCKYTWFVMGSAGRCEQGSVSDQDHGIIFEKATKECISYFQQLGEEIAYGLNEVGYPYCEGKVMSSNPLWCKPMVEWESQLLYWMEKASWDSIRYLQIFYDARGIIGETVYVDQLKNYIHNYRTSHPHLLKRFMENVMHIKKAVGIFGQFLVKSNGPYKDSIDLKNLGYIPYVNAIRLLSIKEGILDSSTMERMDRLLEISSYENNLLLYRENFTKLLVYRISLFKEADSYDDVHYLNIKKLTKFDKDEIKRILKDGRKLYQYVQGIIEKGC